MDCFGGGGGGCGDGIKSSAVSLALYFCVRLFATYEYKFFFLIRLLSIFILFCAFDCLVNFF